MTAHPPHRMRARIGDHEFDAEGREEVVSQQYAQFLEAIAHVTSTVSPSKNGQIGDKVQDGDDEDNDQLSIERLFDRVYLRNGDDSLSLHVIPDSRNANADGILLLIYGYQMLLKQESVKSTDLMEAAKQSGLRIDRIDRNLPAEQRRLVVKGGNRRGSRYTLNNRGMSYCQDVLETMFD